MIQSANPPEPFGGLADKTHYKLLAQDYLELTNQMIVYGLDLPDGWQAGFQ